MGEALTYNQAVALKIVEARGRIRWLTQRGLASRMQALGFDWRQQTVARVELAKRTVTAEELLGLALALETTIQDLLSPSESDAQVAIPSGETVSTDYVASLVYGMDAADGVVTWTDDKPEFGPEAHRTSAGTQMFRKLMHEASSRRPTTIRVEDPVAGTAATFTWPGTPPRPGGD